MWSKKQIKKLISESSTEVIEALQNQDLKVKTLEQSEANWTGEFSSFPEHTSFTGFKGVKVVNNILWIIISGNLSADSDYTAQSSVLVYIDNTPKKYTDKIYTIDGNVLSDVDSYETIAATNTILGNSRDRAYLQGKKDRILLSMYGMSVLTAGNSIQIDCRIPLLLL